MLFRQTLAAILLCATTLTLAPAVNANAAARPSQKPRAKAQTPAPQTEITKEKIDVIVKAMHEAAKAKNVNGIAPYLAPDMKFISRGEGRPNLYVTRAQYLASLRLVFEQVLDYTYLLKSLNITIAPDGQSATVESEVFEMLTFAQGTVAASVVGTTTFKIYKGKILISAMDGTVTRV
ncbi:MAG TPA: nuclear transport factor 2 family protein [Pyrinomonadaceae bacterium]|jgi:vancomycin resistance protein YoaR